MLSIIEVKNVLEANICDMLLTKLIDSERNYDSNINANFIVKNNYCNKINNEYNVLYLAYFNNEPVGYIFGFLKYQKGDFVDQSIGYIDAIYVLESYRKKGIATQLLNCFSNWCKDKQINIIEIGVFKDNHSALKLYEKLGYITQIYMMKKTII